MVEVLVAVVILAFTATAAIKLVVLANNTLRETRTKQALYDAALEIQTGIRIGDKDLSGMSGDITWETVNKEKKFFGGDFGRLNFDKGKLGDTETESIKWRELTVSIKDKEKLVLYLPPEKREQNAELPLSADVLK